MVVGGDGGSAWTWDRRRLGLIVAASVALLALVALAAAIDLPKNDDEQEQAQANEEQTSEGSDADGQASEGQASEGQASEGQGSEGQASEGQASEGQGSEGQASEGQGSGGLGEGSSGGGRIDLGDGSSLELRPIPDCPNGFALGDDILIIPDPEACGYRAVPPGAEGFDPSGKRILTPSIDGEIGGFRVGPDGSVDLLAPGEVGASDIVVGQFSDGTFGLFRPDGTWIEITPGDDGIALRDPIGGDSFFIPRGDELPDGSIFDDEPGAQDTPERPDQSLQDNGPDNEIASSDDSSSDSDSSLGKTLLWILVAVVALGLIALIVVGMRRKDDSQTDDQNTDDGAAQDTVDYSAEIDALDRMLWEIDQEPDPRTAIRRVYAALETGLDNPAMARRRSETPGIYLRRILGRFDELATPLHELTDLFEQARFSEHEITPAMRDHAVRALVAVRGQYARAAASPVPAEPAFG